MPWRSLWARRTRSMPAPSYRPESRYPSVAPPAGSSAVTTLGAAGSPRLGGILAAKKVYT